jgi:hypothetical protein
VIVQAALMIMGLPCKSSLVKERVMIEHMAHYINGKIVIVLNDGRSMAMNMLPSQYGAGMSAAASGARIKDAFPFINADERLFLEIGITDFWDDVFVEV